MGFATYDEAVAAARDKRIEGYKSMALLSQRRAKTNDDDIYLRW